MKALKISPANLGTTLVVIGIAALCSFIGWSLVNLAVALSRAAAERPY